MAISHLSSSSRPLGLYDIVVGLPSYNEVRTISHVTRSADSYLSQHTSSRPSLIVNVDNLSPDGTRHAFETTETATRKVYLPTQGGVRGKGHNILNLLRLAADLDARAVVMLDADVTSVEPFWIGKLVQPILHDGADLVTPVYLRHRFDATVTNHFSFPLIYSVLGSGIRQPIGGDFGISPRLRASLLENTWSQAVAGYGVDMYITCQALLGGFRVYQADLGVKLHSPSAPKLESIFSDIAEVGLELLSNPLSWTLPNGPPLPQSGQRIDPRLDQGIDSSMRITAKYSEIARRLYEEAKTAMTRRLSGETANHFDRLLRLSSGEFTAENWATLVFEVLTANRVSLPTSVALQILRAAFFARVDSFNEAAVDSDYNIIEHRLFRQANTFWHQALTHHRREKD